MEKNTIWVDRITKGWKTAEEIVESINYLTECLMKLHDEDFQLLEQMEEELEDRKLSLEVRVEDLESEVESLEYHIEEIRGRR